MNKNKEGTFLGGEVIVFRKGGSKGTSGVNPLTLCQHLAMAGDCSYTETWRLHPKKPVEPPHSSSDGGNSLQGWLE